MAVPFNLSGLSGRDAVGDALSRAILGIDSNDRSLFESACLTDADMTVIGGGYKIEGVSDAIWAEVKLRMLTRTVKDSGPRSVHSSKGCSSWSLRMPSAMYASSTKMARRRRV